MAKRLLARVRTRSLRPSILTLISDQSARLERKPIELDEIHQQPGFRSHDPIVDVTRVGEMRRDGNSRLATAPNVNSSCSARSIFYTL